MDAGGALLSDIVVATPLPSFDDLDVSCGLGSVDICNSYNEKSALTEESYEN
jgi:hypothetical protein